MPNRVSQPFSRLPFHLPSKSNPKFGMMKVHWHFAGLLLLALFAANNGRRDFHYSKEGNLEVSFNGEGKQDGVDNTFKPTLFFREEKENRQVFNMDVCVDFYETGGDKPEPSGYLYICYSGQLEESKVVKDNPELSMNANDTMKEIERKCNKNKAGNASMRGVKLVFSPPIYEFYSLVDRRMYTINTTEFVEDEVKVYRKNEMAKYCLRMEMGRKPPEKEDVYDQQSQIQEALRYLLFDADAKNKTDNATQFLHDLQGITLTVEDLTQEMVLKTVDLSAHEDAYAFGTQKDRISKRLLGLLGNETEESNSTMYPVENRTREFFRSELLYKDLMPKLKTDKNFKKPNWAELDDFTLYFKYIHFLNFTFNGGNIFPCRTEWVELEKFQMERDFYHPEIQKFFQPIHIAYTVGLVGWKEEEDRGFGPGYEKKGKFGPSDEEIEQLKIVLPKTKGFLDMEKRYIQKFGDVEGLSNDTYQKLEDYYTPLQLNGQKPLGEVTVKQLVFVCADHTFNLPHVASFVEGVGI